MVNWEQKRVEWILMSQNSILKIMRIKLSKKNIFWNKNKKTIPNLAKEIRLINFIRIKHKTISQFKPRI